jgi:hypothetical protein
MPPASPTAVSAEHAGWSDAWVARYDQAGNAIWIRQLGTSRSDYAYCSAPDGAGGAYVGGSSYGSLGGASAGRLDAWLARYDGAGNLLWIRQLGTSGYDIAQATASDGSRGVYVAGTTNGSLGGPKAGAYDAWLARFDGGGSLIWIRQLGTSGDDDVLAAAPESSGGVHVAGQTSGSLGGPSAGMGDAWLAQFDGAGHRVWMRQLGSTFVERAWGVAVDGGSGIYVAGTTSGSFGAPSAGGNDAWLARYDHACGASSSYCTAKVSSAGCVPTISAGGVPSASAGSGFTIGTSHAPDNELGLYLYGKSGPNNASFLGGTLCVQLPLSRTALQNSGGSSPCSGSFQIDFNAYVASGKDPALIAGQQVWAQTWSRDPGFAPPDNTSLSDAVSFTLGP